MRIYIRQTFLSLKDIFYATSQNVHSYMQMQAAVNPTPANTMPSFLLIAARLFTTR